MKIKFLGTAAAEGFPAVFCNCDYCKKARELKGKNIRTRHQTLINDDMLIDLPADTYMHALNNDLRLDKIKYLLITHSHGDHLYPQELAMYAGPYGHNHQVEKIKIFCGKGSEQKLINFISPFLSAYKDIMEVIVLECYKETDIGDGYKITALPARHLIGDDSRIYIIEQKGKKILYAHDTGLLYQEVFDYIENNKVRLDFISLDFTNGSLITPDDGTHMGVCQIEKVLKSLVKIKAIDDKTIKYVNHYSHNANPIQEEYEALVNPLGFNVAYDGEEVKI